MERCPSSSIASQACSCDMRFAVFTPPQAQSQRVPVLWYLSGLTCTWENVMTKAGLQRTAAALGLMVIAPDTSPRGDDVPDDPAYDLGKGAGFYLTATQQPWAKHYRMDQYVADELQARRRRQLPRGRSYAPRHHRSFDGRSRRADAAPETSAALSLGFSVLADRGAVAGAVGAEGVHGLSRQRSQRVAELRCDRARQEAAVDRAHPDRPGCRGSISGTRAATAALRRRGKVSGPAGDAADCRKGTTTRTTSCRPSSTITCAGTRRHCRAKARPTA